MIKILVLKQNNNILAIEATGHSGYAEAGYDIVCCAVSTLTQNLAQSLSLVAGVKADVIIDEDIPHISIKLPNLTAEKMHDAQLLMNSTYLGLKDVAKEYKKYINLKEKNK